MWLIKFEANWADEFDCQQFEVVDSKEGAKAYVEECLALRCFGSNQGWEEGEITTGHFQISELNAKEYAVLEELFGQTWGNVKFGTGPL